jgi:hypothetical protein
MTSVQQSPPAGVIKNAMSRSSATFAALLLCLAGLIASARAGSADPVAVSSTSTEDYARQKFGKGEPRPESYLFFQGKFFGGTVRDANLEHAQFLDIAKILAENLVRQKYYPTKDQKNADLLIVVHWGVTSIYENPNKQLDTERLYNAQTADAAAQEASPSLDHSALNLELAIGDLERGTEENSVAYNARLLGYRQQLANQTQVIDMNSGMTAEELSLREQLSEERYFVILMAYDYRTMKKDQKPKLLWSTRFSIRSPGRTFTKALPEMSKVASSYFGQALDGLKQEAPGAPTGKVELGIPRVVGDGK